MEQTQILQIDHSFNASTFTARVVTSTLAPPASALAAAMGSLYGPLHGAADQGALEMAQEVGDPNAPRISWPNALANGRLVMGMGHREYRVVDPRSRIVKSLAEEIASQPDEKRLIETLKAVDEAFVAQTAHKKRVAARQSGVLQRRRVPGAGTAEGILYGDICGRPYIRLVGPHRGTAQGQSHRSSLGKLHRSCASA